MRVKTILQTFTSDDFTNLMSTLKFCHMCDTDHIFFYAIFLLSFGQASKSFVNPEYRNV